MKPLHGMDIVGVEMVRVGKVRKKVRWKNSVWECVYERSVSVKDPNDMLKPGSAKAFQHRPSLCVIEWFLNIVG